MAHVLRFLLPCLVSCHLGLAGPLAAQELVRCLSVMSVATCELHRAASARPQERTEDT